MAKEKSEAASCLAAPTANDILEFLVGQGIIDLDGVETEMSKANAKRILDNHLYAIYQGKDGRWRTYIPDSENPYGRKLLVKNKKLSNHFIQNG